MMMIIIIIISIIIIIIIITLDLAGNFLSDVFKIKTLGEKNTAEKHTSLWVKICINKISINDFKETGIKSEGVAPHRYPMEQ